MTIAPVCMLYTYMSCWQSVRLLPVNLRWLPLCCVRHPALKSSWALCQSLPQFQHPMLWHILTGHMEDKTTMTSSASGGGGLTGMLAGGRSVYECMSAHLFTCTHTYMHFSPCGATYNWSSLSQTLHTTLHTTATTTTYVTHCNYSHTHILI